MALDNEKTVLDFLAAWPRANVDELMSYFAPDAVYHNVPVAPIHGAAGIRAIFQGFLGLTNRIDLGVVNSAAKGNVEAAGTYGMTGDLKCAPPPWCAGSGPCSTTIRCPGHQRFLLS